MQILVSKTTKHNHTGLLLTSCGFWILFWDARDEIGVRILVPTTDRLGRIGPWTNRQTRTKFSLLLEVHHLMFHLAQLLLHRTRIKWITHPPGGISLTDSCSGHAVPWNPFCVVGDHVRGCVCWLRLCGFWDFFGLQNFFDHLEKL